MRIQGNTTPRNGWVLDQERLVLDLYRDGRHNYEVDLETCTTAAHVLDWIMQVAGKSERVVSDEHLGQLVRQLDRVLAPQETLCSFGVDRGPIDPKVVVHRCVRMADALDAVPLRADGSLDIAAIMRAGNDAA
jgi:hypothetical protein